MPRPGSATGLDRRPPLTWVARDATFAEVPRSAGASGSVSLAIRFQHHSGPVAGDRAARRIKPTGCTGRTPGIRTKRTSTWPFACTNRPPTIWRRPVLSGRDAPRRRSPQEDRRTPQDRSPINSRIRRTRNPGRSRSRNFGRSAFRSVTAEWKSSFAVSVTRPAKTTKTNTRHVRHGAI